MNKSYVKYERKMGNMHKNFVGELQREKPLYGIRRNVENRIKVVLREIW
jgi:hypothetical protein